MIAAIILGAGLSSRMGLPKLILPWGKTTVIGQVVEILTQAGISESLVVTGGARLEVEQALRGVPVQLVFNPRFENGEMMDSLQVGLAQLSQAADATLIALGDQPQIQLSVVQSVLETYRQQHANLVVPSYKMKRGHPWLVGREHWKELSQIHPPETMREFLGRHAAEITHLPVSTDTVLRDLDTPTDYAREKPVA